MLDDGTPLDDELLHKLRSIPATVLSESVSGEPTDLEQLRQQEIDLRLEHVQTRNITFFDEEVAKLDRWSDDLKYGPEHELKEIDREIADARGAASLAHSLQERLDTQKAIRTLEGKRARKRRDLYEAQDNIDLQRNELIGKLEGQLQQRLVNDTVFGMSWIMR